MIVIRRAGVPGAFLVLVALVVAACGGATGSTGASASAPAASEPAASQPAASEAASEQPTASDILPSLGAIPSFDLEALAGTLPVDSYRTQTSLNGVPQFETVVVKEPELSKAITIYDQGEITTRFIIIGDEAWMAEGANGEFVAPPGGSQFATTMLAAYDPALMLGAWAGVDWAGTAANVGTEEKNGVQAHHLRIDSTTFVGAASAMPAGAAIDVWVADEGYLIAWEMSGFEEDANFSIEVTNINDPANKVERPD
jgi:hypothetical protein